MIKEERIPRPLERQISDLFVDSVGWSEHIQIFWYENKADIVLNGNKIGTIRHRTNNFGWSLGGLVVWCDINNETAIKKIVNVIDKAMPDMQIDLVIQE